MEQSKPETCINFDVELRTKNLKFEVKNYVSISKYEYRFSKTYIPNWAEEYF